MPYLQRAGTTRSLGAHSCRVREDLNDAYLSVLARERAKIRENSDSHLERISEGKGWEGMRLVVLTHGFRVVFCFVVVVVVVVVLWSTMTCWVFGISIILYSGAFSFV